jgi:hypothetical protein
MWLGGFLAIDVPLFNPRTVKSNAGPPWLDGTLLLALVPFITLFDVVFVVGPV